ncbi:hypothetical protein AB0C29_21705 [Actinoplanes sp. NPDC048791]|uniref:hypothetical protein n=1 Tax=Actinoplanes sp. NPDC048791 TaxID=3154623 RepID=UPI0033EDE6D1
MTFRVEPTDLVAYAARLREVYSDVEMAKNFVHAHGDFSFHESGIIGALAGQHASLMHQLEELHDQLLTILWRSSESLLSAANDYQTTDKHAAARVDASYPESPRAVPSRD